MIESPREGPSPADGKRASVRVGPKRLSIYLAFLLLAGALADIGLARFGLNPLQGLQQLLMLAVLGLYVLGFTIAIHGMGTERIAAKAASLSALLQRRRRLAASILIGLGVAGALLAAWILRAFPNSGDEYDYIFEAKTFLAGRLWNPLPPLPDLFAHYHLLFLDGKWVAGYSPGWPLLLAAVMGLHLPPWLAAPLCGGVLLFAVLKLGQKRDGALGGILAAALVALSPFFLFNAGSYFDNLPAAAVGLLFCWAALEFLGQPRWANAISAGLALGMLGLIRSQDVVLFGLPFAGQFLWQAGRHHYRPVLGIVLAGLPFLAVLLFYNHAVFGSLLPPTNLESSALRFGLFSVDDMGHYRTPFDELYLVAERMVMLANWPSPLLSLGYAATFGFAAFRRRLDFLDFIFPACVLGFMLVPFNAGNQYGPRYYFEGFPLLVLTVVSALRPLLQDPRFLRWRPFVALLLAAHGAACLAALAIIAPFLRTVVDQRMDLYDQVRVKNLHNAVVVVHSSTGVVVPMLPLDLTRNGIAANGKVLYVLDLPDQVHRFPDYFRQLLFRQLHLTRGNAFDLADQLRKLNQLLPDRRFYIYDRTPSDLRGSLRQLW